MSKIEFLISISGKDFDAERYAHDVGLEITGRFLSNRTVLSKSRIPGTDGVHGWWISKTSYTESLKSFEGGSIDICTSGWREVEDAIVNYIDGVVAKLPNMSEYCHGEYSRELIVSYRETSDRQIGGFLFSPRLFEKLASMHLHMEIGIDKEDE